MVSMDGWMNEWRETTSPHYSVSPTFFKPANCLGSRRVSNDKEIFPHTFVDFWAEIVKAATLLLHARWNC